MPASASDAGADALEAPDDAPPLPRCSPDAPFLPPTLLSNINSPLGVDSFSLPSDELSAFVSANGGEFVLKLATRPSIELEFSIPEAAPAISAINAANGVEANASVSSDGLLLYFVRANTAQFTTQVLVSTRAIPTGTFSAGDPVTISGDALFFALNPQVSRSELTLYWIDDVDFKLRSASRSAGSPNAFFTRRVESVMTVGPTVAISADELTLYYQSSGDVYVTTRPTKGEPFSPGAPLATVNSPSSDRPLHLASDGCMLWLASDRAGGLGGQNIWAAQRGM